jgi:hypothetical protein
VQLGADVGIVVGEPVVVNVVATVPVDVVDAAIVVSVRTVPVVVATEPPLVIVNVDSTGILVTVEVTTMVSKVVKGTVIVWVDVVVGDVELGVCPDVFVGTNVEELTLGMLVAKGCDVGSPPVSKVV